MRPGVQTMTSVPRLSSAICSAMEAPPKMAVTLSSRARAKRRASETICVTSSRLGAMTSARGPVSPAERGRWSRSCRKRGRR